VLNEVVEVQQGRGYCLCEPACTTVYHGCCHCSGCSVCIPEHWVLGLVEGVSGCTLLAWYDDLVLNCSLDEGLDNGTDGSGCTILLDEVVYQVVCIQTLVGVEEQLCTFEWSDCGSHFELSCLFKGC